MPYKDKTKQRQYQRDLMRKRRGSNTLGLIESNGSNINLHGLTRSNKIDTKPFTTPIKSIVEHPKPLNTNQSKPQGVKTYTQPPQPLHDKEAIEMLTERMKIGTSIDLPFSKAKQVKGRMRG